jgi:hypothetical protein
MSDRPVERRERILVLGNTTLCSPACRRVTESPRWASSKPVIVSSSTVSA